MPAEASATSSPSIQPTQFADDGQAISPRVVVACTFDPLGLQGPLHTWLRRLTGQRCSLHWVGYGMVLESLLEPTSIWCEAFRGRSLNVLIMRWSDLKRADEREALVAAMRACALRHGQATLVLLPPSADADGDDDVFTTALRSIGGSVTVVAPPELRAALDANSEALGAWHSPFLDGVAHAPFSPAANSIFASLICRELHRACAPMRKVYCLDCDNTLWGGAVGEVGPHGVVLSEDYLAVQRCFVARQARGALVSNPNPNLNPSPDLDNLDSKPDRCFVARQARGALLCLVSRNHEEDVSK